MRKATSKLRLLAYESDVTWRPHLPLLSRDLLLRFHVFITGTFACEWQRQPYAWGNAEVTKRGEQNGETNMGYRRVTGVTRGATQKLQHWETKRRHKYGVTGVTGVTGLTRVINMDARPALFEQLLEGHKGWGKGNKFKE